MPGKTQRWLGVDDWVGNVHFWGRRQEATGEDARVQWKEAWPLVSRRAWAKEQSKSKF